MYFNTSIKEDLTECQKRYLASLRKQLSNLELLGKKHSDEWCEIDYEIGEIENNL